jgi:hypothetical protein
MPKARGPRVRAAETLTVELTEMSSVAASHRGLASTADAHRSTIAVRSWWFAVSGTLAVVAAMACAATFLVPGVLVGPAVMNGSARGTALVVLALAVPVLGVSMYLVARGAVRPVITWLGAATYILYNSFLFLTGTPFNGLFLFYVAMFSLSFWAVALGLHTIHGPGFAMNFSRGLPARALAAFLGAVAVLNVLAWLGQAVPALFGPLPPAFVNGTGLATSPTYVQDLSFWLPLTLVAAIWLWQRRPWGLVLSGTLLAYGVLEGIGVAVDQAFGHAADPSSSVVVVMAIPGFLALAVVELIALSIYLRHLNQANLKEER